MIKRGDHIKRAWESSGSRRYGIDLDASRRRGRYRGELRVDERTHASHDGARMARPARSTRGLTRAKAPGFLSIDHLPEPALRATGCGRRTASTASRPAETAAGRRLRRAGGDATLPLSPRCESEVCLGELCRAANCENGTQDQGEVGIDCAGPCSCVSVKPVPASCAPCPEACWHRELRPTMDLSPISWPSCP
jgi:hypothetical protein